MESMTKQTVSTEQQSPRPVRRERGRWIVAGLAAGLAGIGVLWIWGIRHAGLLPDVGDPFDVAAAHKPVIIRDDDNAYVLYREASRRLSKFPQSLHSLDFAKLTWSQADAEARAYLDKNGQALEIWREGSDRPEAVYHQPGELAIDTLLGVIQDSRYLSWLAALEGSRHEEKGEMADAWTWYRAILRSSRHAGMHGVVMERLVGAAVFEKGAQRVLNWAADPRVDAGLLRVALDDVLAADAMTAPFSRAIQLEYLMVMRDLSELRVTVQDMPMPGGRFGWLEQVTAATGAKPTIQRVRLQATNDVDRSRRVARLLFANWLAQADKPVAERATIAIAKPTVIFAADADAPPAARAVAPEILDKALEHAAFAHETFRPDEQSSGGFSLWNAPWDQKKLGGEPRRRAVLIVKLAAELYRREHGKLPVKAGELVGSCLKALPVEIKAGDAIPASFD
jgi:hypothetical protein